MNHLNQMHNPPHPGSVLADVVFPSLETNITEAAKEIGVSRISLSRVANNHAAISSEMAVKIERWLCKMGREGGSAEYWLTMQMQYDLWHLRKGHFHLSQSQS